MRLLLTVTLALLVGCAEEDGYREWTGESVRIIAHQSVDIEPCGGQVAFSDRMVALTTERWGGGEAAPLDAVVELRSSPEGGHAGAARAGGFAWAAEQRVFLHELGHLVTTATDGASMPVFSEGVAQMIGSSEQNYFIAIPPVENFAFLDRPEFGARQYEYAAQLLAFLARRHGMAKVREAYRAAEFGSSPEETEAVFVGVFGDTIYDDFDDLEAETTCPVFFWECDAGVQLELPFDIRIDPQTCGGEPDVAGFTSASSDDWWPVYYGGFSLAEPRVLGITLVNAYISRDLCTETCAPFEVSPPRARDSFSSMSGTQRLEIPTLAGQHQFRVSPVDPQQPFSATVVDLGAF